MKVMFANWKDLINILQPQKCWFSKEDYWLEFTVFSYLGMMWCLIRMAVAKRSQSEAFLMHNVFSFHHRGLSPLNLKVFRRACNNVFESKVKLICFPPFVSKQNTYLLGVYISIFWFSCLFWPSRLNPIINM